MSETKPKNLQDYLMEHGILKNADAEKMVKEIMEMFENKITEKFARYEAACAEMRSAMEKQMCWCREVKYISGSDAVCNRCKALSTDCGKGVLERIEKLREMLVRHHNYRIEVNTCNGLAYSGSLRSTTEQVLEETK